MKTEEKKALKELLLREPDETDMKIFDVMTDMGLSTEPTNPYKFSVDFGKKCFEMGKSFSRADIIAKVNGPLKDELDRILGDDESNL